MAAFEMWDYLSNVTADYTVSSGSVSIDTLTVNPQRVLTEAGAKNQVVHTGDDGTEEIVTLSNVTRFYATLQWDTLPEASAGTIFDQYHNTAKANGIANSFYWDHPTDAHSYCVRFAGPLSRNIRPGSLHGIASVKLKVLGRKP